MGAEREGVAIVAHTFGERLIELFMHPTKAIGGVGNGLGIATAISAIMAQMEYWFKKNDIKDLYKRELAAQLGKSEKKVNVTDLEKLGTVNRTIKEQLVKTKKERNIDIGTIFAATMVSVAVAGAIITAAPVVASLGTIGTALATLTTTFSAATLTTAVSWIAGTAAGMLAYIVAKSPIQKIGEKLFGVDKKTTHERIEEIHKDHEAGKVISRERVFDVFVHANPTLDQFIKANYGKEFDKLKVGQKIRITEEIGAQLGIGKITHDINQGRLQATELAFTVQGSFSGVAPTLGDEPKSVVSTVKEKLHHAADVFTGYHPADDKPEGFSFAQRVVERRTTAAAISTAAGSGIATGTER